MTPLRIAVTADLHWGSVHREGDSATRLLADALKADPPDLLILAGDVGAGDHFAGCLELFADLPGLKAVVPGNHDIWVMPDDPRGDSLDLYRDRLPDVSRRFGFHYLDAGPLILPGSGLAVAGTMNWYDYSWSIDRLPAAAPDYEERLRTKRFTRGRLNDARFVRWPHTDPSFTREIVETFGRHLDEALARADRVIVVTHHPTFHGLSFPEPGDREMPPPLDRLLWEAFAGNRAIEELLERHADRIAFAFCGHTHRARENRLGPIRGYNVGGDYHFKRLLRLDWPAGTVTAAEFADDYHLLEPAV
jgi:predicted phosphohydrolase